jgi:hypothetical protein
MDQLRKLRHIYSSEIAAIEKLLSECDQKLHKAYNVLSLQGQLYTAKRMHGSIKATGLHFLTRLLARDGQGHGTIPVTAPVTKEPLLRVNEAD